MAQICLSTGWFYANKLNSLAEQERIIREAGADGIEIVGANQNNIADLLGTERFGKFDYVSLHANYDKKLGLEMQVKQILDMQKNHNAQNIIIHPTEVPEGYYQSFFLNEIPLTIENMDKTKQEGKDMLELASLVEAYDFKFVLDIQHAYEHDSHMMYARSLYNIFSERLVEIHVSGQNSAKDEPHSLVYKAENKDTVLDFTNKVLSLKKVPIVLEGKFTAPVELKAEIDFLRKELEH